MDEDYFSKIAMMDSDLIEIVNIGEGGTNDSLNRLINVIKKSSDYENVYRPVCKESLRSRVLLIYC